MVRNLSDVLDPVWIVRDASWKAVTEFEGVRFSPYYPGIRAELDLSQYLRNTNVVEIYFPFNKSDDFSVKIIAFHLSREPCLIFVNLSISA